MKAQDGSRTRAWTEILRRSAWIERVRRMDGERPELARRGSGRWRQSAGSATRALGAGLSWPGGRTSNSALALPVSAWHRFGGHYSEAKIVPACLDRGLRPHHRRLHPAKQLPRSSHVAEATPAKERGAGLIVVATPLLISRTESPRSLVPSGRKRKTPSAPLKPERLVSTFSE